MKTESENEKLRTDMQSAFARKDIMRSLTAADELLRREPTDVDAMFVAATSLMTNGHEGLASIILNTARCATKDPEKLGPIWNNLGYAFQDYQPAEAYRAFTTALTFGGAPGYTYDNLCSIAHKLGRYAEALEWAEKAKDCDTAYNRAFPLLSLGRWEEAWAAYAKSAGSAHRPRTDRHYDLPRWDGKEVGKVILHGEQGVGDEIMFMSMCPKDFDGVIDCNPRTAELFQRSFPDATVYGTLLKDFIEWPLDEKADYHLEMGGLGEIYAPKPFAHGAFLKAHPARVEAARVWCDAASEKRNGPTVGIAWTGGTWSTGRGQRSVPFDLIEAMIRAHPDVTFVNLEYEDRKAELSDLPQVLNPHWATKKGADLDDLAALLSSLDLVITATNSTVDLAGALGVPCWALVDAYPQWRYSTAAGEHSMWFYESVRTFRQKIADNGRWGRVMDLVSKAMKDRYSVQEAA
jgi:tetratricopeptide (TPR) repeat protein